MKYSNIEEAIEQLLKCDFKCKAGDLNNNSAFKYLQKIAKESPNPCPYYDETEIYTLPVVTFSKNAPWNAEWHESVVMKDMNEATKLLNILEKEYGIKNHHQKDSN